MPQGAEHTGVSAPAVDFLGLHSGFYSINGEHRRVLCGTSTASSKHDAYEVLLTQPLDGHSAGVLKKIDDEKGKDGHFSGWFRTMSESLGKRPLDTVEKVEEKAKKKLKPSFTFDTSKTFAGASKNSSLPWLSSKEPEKFSFESISSSDSTKPFSFGTSSNPFKTSSIFGTPSNPFLFGSAKKTEAKDETNGKKLEIQKKKPPEVKQKQALTTAKKVSVKEAESHEPVKPSKEVVCSLNPMKLYIFDDGRWVEKGKGELQIFWTDEKKTRAQIVVTRESVMTLLLNSVVNNVCIETIKESKKHLRMYVNTPGLKEGSETESKLYLVTGRPLGVATFADKFGKLKKKLGGLDLAPHATDAAKTSPSKPEPKEGSSSKSRT